MPTFRYIAEMIGPAAANEIVDYLLVMPLNQGIAFFEDVIGIIYNPMPDRAFKLLPFQQIKLKKFKEFVELLPKKISKAMIRPLYLEKYDTLLHNQDIDYIYGLYKSIQLNLI
jgi:hypothetical protein